MIGRSNIPLVTEGEALFHIATFDAAAKVAERIEQVEENLGSDMIAAMPTEPPIV